MTFLYRSLDFQISRWRLNVCQFVLRRNWDWKNTNSPSLSQSTTLRHTWPLIGQKYFSSLLNKRRNEEVWSKPYGCRAAEGIPAQIHRFTLSYQRRVYNTIHSCSVSMNRVTEAETASRANVTVEALWPPTTRLTCTHSAEKTLLGQTSPRLSEGSAFGSLGRGLLWFLSSPRSHRRRACLPFTAPLRRCCCCCRLAPRPTAGGKQGASVSPFVWSVMFRCCENLSLFIQELLVRAFAISSTSLVRVSAQRGAWVHIPFENRKNDL